MRSIDELRGRLVAQIFCICEDYLSRIERDIQRNVLKHELKVCVGNCEIGKLTDTQDFSPYVMIVHKELKDIDNEKDVQIAAAYIEQELKEAGYQVVIDKFYNQLDKKDACTVKIVW